jgi:hypothetical protein
MAFRRFKQRRIEMKKILISQLERLAKALVLVGLLISISITQQAQSSEPYTGVGIGNVVDTVNSIAIGDLDGDGDLDIVSASGPDEDYEIIAWENPLNTENTDGTSGNPFVEPWDSNNVGTLGVQINSVALADLNNNGDLDIVTGGSGLTTVFEVNCWQNDGSPFDGTWSSNPVKNPWHDRTLSVNSLAIGDLDNDGWLDIVSGHDREYSKPTVYAWGNPGNSEDQVAPFNDYWTQSVVGYTYSHVYSIAVGYLDNNSYLDIASVVHEAKVVLWENPGNSGTTGIPEDWTKYVAGYMGDRGMSIALGNLDDGDDLDIVTGSRMGSTGSKDEVLAWKNLGTPSFLSWTSNEIGPTGYAWVMSVAIGDLDNDGDLDVVSRGGGGPKYEVNTWKNDGSPFSGKWIKDIVGKCDTVFCIGPIDGVHQKVADRSVAVGDLDNDGDLDIISGHDFCPAPDCYEIIIWENSTDNQPPTAEAGGPYSGNEGGTIALSGASATDGDGDNLTYTWSVNSASCSFSDPTTLNPDIVCDDNGIFSATLTVNDGVNDPVGDSSNVTVINVAPTATFNVPVEVSEGSDINMSLTGPFDPSSVDTSTGFEYAFDCGEGYGCFEPGDSAGCPTIDDGIRSVGGKIKDKDDGVTEYTTDVSITNIAPTIALADNDKVDEGSLYTLTLGQITDPGDDTVIEWVVYWGDGDVESFFAGGVVTHVYKDNGAVTLTVDLVDEDGFHPGAGSKAVTVENVPPNITTLTGPTEPIQVDTPISFNATFIDPGVLDTHTAVWDWGDGNSTTQELVTSPVTAEYAYTVPGVYTVSLTVTDMDGGSDTEYFQYVVVYNPDGGFVTGGGGIDSPAGAFIADPSLTGKATFGFVSKYKKGANVPTGQTQFQFKVADLNFHSSSYDWLVVAGAKAKYKGVGAINGEGEYKFMLSAIDADINDNDSFNIDRFRIKIWQELTDGTEIVVYDNGLGDDDATTEISGGSIVVHKEK